MEQRLHPRESVGLAVRLVQEGHIIATAQAIDMSSEGLGIEHPSVALNSGQIVGVDFFKPGYPRGISCCVRSMVVHVSPESIGLMHVYDPDLRMLSPEHCGKSSDHNDQGVSHDKPTTA